MRLVPVAWKEFIRKRGENGEGSSSTFAAWTQKVEGLRNKFSDTVIWSGFRLQNFTWFSRARQHFLSYCLVTVINCNFCLKGSFLRLVESSRVLQLYPFFLISSCNVLPLFSGHALWSPVLCGLVQFLEILLLVSSIARAVNVLSLDSCFLETLALTTLLTCAAYEYLATHPAEACLETGAAQGPSHRVCSFGGFIPWWSKCLSDLKGVSVLTAGVQ